MIYRKEIDGLRAIAVLSVVLFHGGFLGFNGGYVGVDIFFVISGYLITNIILEDKKNNNFSIINFYERRARRILPALSMVLMVTTTAAYLFMPVELLAIYSKSLISITAFSSNIYFFFSNGYFSPVSDTNPLLHTWSLAVEEQYYFIFPVVVMLFWSFGKNILLIIIIIIAIISLLITQILLFRHAVDANFYLIFSRAWELLFGSIIAFIPIQKLQTSRLAREFLGGCGLIMICYSVVFFDDKTPFPSFYTIIPVLGACLIIVFSSSVSYTGRFLSNKILVPIGLISYSLYLWHQPLFSFLRLKSIGEPSLYMYLVAILFSFIIAFFNWKYIEKPFRNKSVFTRSAIFKCSGLSIIFFFLIGLLGYINNGFSQRYNSYSSSIQYSPKRESCHTKGNDFLKPENACKYFSNNVTWATFGDSHTVELAYTLAKRLEKHNAGLLQLSFSGCPPALLFEAARDGCTKWLNESLTYLEKDKTIKQVLLGFRYTGFLYGSQLDMYPNLPRISLDHPFFSSHHNIGAEGFQEIYWNSLKAIVSRLLKAGKDVYLMYPVPELPLDINMAVMPFSVFNTTTMLNLGRVTDKKYYINRNEYILKKLDSLPFGNKLHAIKPFEIMCTDGYCPAVVNGKALYFDDNHLSLAGAKLISDSILMN